METTEKDRIEQLMQAENLNATQFAAEIGIKSPTLSHILSGRNNPSLDVLKKILDRYRTISSDWLILGIGQMYRNSKQSQTPSLFDNIDENANKSVSYIGKNAEKTNIVVDTVQKKNAVESLSNQKMDPIQVDYSKIVKKIIVYYNDNTFQEFDTK
ncbi:MAG: helix-turn-helix domain protein [Bacteroidetes bacterium]|nr:helix-turn-helix domain protein [Bacteroidota bacterium]